MRDSKKPKALAESLINKLGIVTPGVSTPVGRLSGGNVRKVLVGREIAMQSGYSSGGLSGARSGY